MGRVHLQVQLGPELVDDPAGAIRAMTAARAASLEWKPDPHVELELAKLRSAARQVRRLGINVAGTTDDDEG